ncbi:tRNA (adenosine(37)-N6)-threonylcarbamoyltransferase complex ATPase subunit type 1 TsaE [Desulfotalea psychrophila]|uniref:tRNA threonylcarbamoyladenosine biosynthesis protein TsaE n=1 Tax=Desulfotalea psychrophila (strain LSv54 / DSM 12343) TaxID=177439 RepID=Q6ALU0_DESPS|nr:tRNA (adenosine(37)-N6)-threonylcarbamoyltransferase complex ATPase subunit type 1 TsaE [Desulfotalea psychrophila]CAG36685.1 conserved hypothetical protein [Desulfotalea psychrophila LSv54]
MDLSYNISSLAETEILGLFLGHVAEAGDVICLEGDLGAGKTTLTQYIARGLEVDPREYVTSPSFAILHEYQGRIPLYHMDLYRLGGEDEVIDLGFEEYFYGGGLTVIEWPSRAYDLIPEQSLYLQISFVDEESRAVRFSCKEASSWGHKIKEFLLHREKGE